MLAVLRVATLAAGALLPHVHVLVPSRHLRDVHALDSLWNASDHAFGRVTLHFGVDWATDAGSVDADRLHALAPASWRYVVHRVFDRMGDLSSVVNHMFARINEPAYFFRYNDDTRMETAHWNRLCIEALRSGCDAGLARVHDANNARLQTHSFVSGYHKRVFGAYFPAHFHNWYEDDWITAVYAAHTHNTTVRVRHAAAAERYAIRRVPPEVFDVVVREDRIRLARALREHTCAAAPATAAP